MRAQELPEEQRCTARAKGTGERCRDYRMRGQRVCFKHGGAAGQSRVAAKRRLAEAKAAQTLAEVGVETIGDPLEAFRDLASEVVAFKDYAAARVAELSADLANRDAQGREDVRAMVGMYERGLDRAGRLLEQYARLGIAERLTQLDERRALLVEAVIVRVVQALGHDPGSQAVRAVVHRELLAASPRVVEVSRGD